MLADIRVTTDASPEAIGGILTINGKIIAAFFSTIEEKQASDLLVEFQQSSSQGVLEAPGGIGNFGGFAQVERETEEHGAHPDGAE